MHRRLNKLVLSTLIESETSRINTRESIIYYISKIICKILDSLLTSILTIFLNPRKYYPKIRYQTEVLLISFTQLSKQTTIVSQTTNEFHHNSQRNIIMSNIIS